MMIKGTKNVIINKNKNKIIKLFNKNKYQLIKIHRKYNQISKYNK